MKLDSFILGLIAFSMLVVGSYLIFDGIADAYDLSVTKYDAGYNDSFAVTEQELFNDVETIKNGTIYSDIASGDTTEDSLFKSTFKAAKLVGNSFSIVNKLLALVSTSLGIPKVFVSFAIIGLTISIIFAIILLVLRLKG